MTQFSIFTQFKLYFDLLKANTLQLKILFSSFLLVMFISTVCSGQEEIAGCTYCIACNYNPLATIHDGNCDFTSCAGCTYEYADNYDPNALFNDGSCMFTLGGFCPYDLDDSGVVDSVDLLFFLSILYEPCEQQVAIVTESCAPESPVGGCNIPMACNYTSDATFDDGSCWFSCHMGCTYTGGNGEAANYDPAAQIDDGSCIFPNPNCPWDCNADNETDVVDLLCFLSAFGTSC